jgi:DNA-binding XRE family transcriptional regulator
MTSESNALARARGLRLACGLTQQRAAQLLGLSRRTVQNFEAIDCPAWYILALEQLAYITKKGTQQ